MDDIYVYKDHFDRLDFDRLTREVNILLISDLHYDADLNKYDDAKDLANHITTKLVEHLEEQTRKDRDWTPDIIIVAGDLVNKGKAHSYEFYFILIEKLTKKFKWLKNAVFTTPGNHDINRDNVVAAFPYLFELKKNDRDYKTKDSYTFNEFVNTIYTISQYPLTDDKRAESRKSLIDFETAYFETYLEKEQEIIARGIVANIKNKYPITGLRTAYYRTLLGVTIASVNSSFFCSLSQTGDDRNRLFYITDVIDAMRAELKNSTTPVITFMHHPYFFMHESEYIYPIDEKNNDNNFNKIADYSDLVLSGHVHGELHLPSVVNQKAHTITNGSTFTNQNAIGRKSFPFTYALVKVNKQLEKFRVRNFVYDTRKKRKNDFKENTNSGQEYFSFQPRGYTRKVSAEMEKINVINTIKSNAAVTSAGLSSVDLESELILMQAELFGSFNKEVVRNIFGPFKGFTLTSDKDNAKTDILKLTGPKPFENLISYLTQQDVSAGNRLYIAVDTRLVSTTEDGLPENVEPFSSVLKQTILRSKCENCRLNFIYY